MKVLFYIHGITLFQLLFSTSASTVPAYALATPQNASTEPLDQSLTSTPPIKRAWPDHRHTFFVINTSLGYAWHVRFNVLEWISSQRNTIPTQDLLLFYRAVLSVARVSWAHDETKTVRRAAFNGIVLMFWSDQPIAWEFLNGFFEHMIERTSGGLVGGYEVTCFAQATGAIVNVMLSLPGGELQAAPAAKRTNSKRR